MVMSILMMLILLVDVYLMLISILVVLILKRFLVDCGVITTDSPQNYDVDTVDIDVDVFAVFNFFLVCWDKIILEITITNF
jgi:hypothetical protein